MEIMNDMNGDLSTPELSSLGEKIAFNTLQGYGLIKEVKTD